MRCFDEASVSFWFVLAFLVGGVCHRSLCAVCCVCVTAHHRSSQSSRIFSDQGKLPHTMLQVVATFLVGN